jgi:hypothetical protein
MVRSPHFLNYSNQYGAILLMVYIIINNTINATSEIMEAHRDGVLPFLLWEPFVWEYSSAISILLLVPGVVFLLNYQPFNFHSVTRSIGLYFFASIIFSVMHVSIMVAMRKLIYFSQASHYDFGLLWYEFIYEYRKDAWSFIFLIVVIKGYQYLIAQLKGEAHILQKAEASVQPQFERLLVRKLGQEFIIKVRDVEWLESAGNYVNLHIDGRIYPLRATLTKLSKQLEPQGFCRIHRSHAIRLDAICSITPIQSGDSEVTLNSGKKLYMSRRYKEQFKDQLLFNQC